MKIINRNNFEQLASIDMSSSRLLYVCPKCGKLSSILPGSEFVDEQRCIEDEKIMELLLVECG